MNKRTHILICLTILLVNTWMSDEALAVDPPSDVTAYPVSVAPLVDGQISPGEYAGAVPINVDFLDPDSPPGVVAGIRATGFRAFSQRAEGLAVLSDPDPAIG